MAMTGWEFNGGWFQNVESLVEQNDILFKTKVIPQGGPDQYQIAVDRIIEHRKWKPSESLFRHRMEAILRELDVFYVPKQLEPGPCFCFIYRDIKGRRVQGKIRPLHDIIFRDIPAKYAGLGAKYEFCGPTWVGNSDETLKLIMRLGFVVLVEGPFDTLACRLIAGGVPVLSSGTKTLNDMHFAYLKVLGVKTTYFMYDRDKESQAGRSAQLGLKKMAEQEGMIWTALVCPAQDPSACLEDYRNALALKRALEILL